MTTVFKLKFIKINIQKCMRSFGIIIQFKQTKPTLGIKTTPECLEGP
jgi:hypothetical protein